jgi:hypothetical protein
MRFNGNKKTGSEKSPVNLNLGLSTCKLNNAWAKVKLEKKRGEGAAALQGKAK